MLWAKVDRSSLTALSVATTVVGEPACCGSGASAKPSKRELLPTSHAVRVTGIKRGRLTVRLVPGETVWVGIWLKLCTSPRTVYDASGLRRAAQRPPVADLSWSTGLRRRRGYGRFVVAYRAPRSAVRENGVVAFTVPVNTSPSR
ncbi:hypothetical protein GCM10027028_06330 [Streptomyces sundarbansensis]